MAEDSIWYYAEKGERVGPVSETEIKQLIKQGKLHRESLVWNGCGDWQAAKDTSLSETFNTQGNGPPPLAGKYVDNRFAWAIVAIPLIGIVIEFLTGSELVWLYIVLNIVFCIMDAIRIEKAGYRAPVKWAAFLVPVYLWKRASLLNQKRYHFAGWIAAIALSIFISVKSDKFNLEEAAKPVVTEIIKEQFYADRECKSVHITEDSGNGFYKAVATLDNGNDMRITIENKGQHIYVQIPYGQ